ncbi:lp_1002 family arylesterase [Pediococcus pentosaceus]|uniref:alpha/beta hydrolase n=1 Tax=Pediococcus pentosaceus TaxID=1255 RepID=UPI0018A161B8|nr:alpha/beta hydrolase [Pediococcus pentosaceus]MBF7129610.1 alpha/beta hydrolase [Pediococcus pentosaceus]
MEIVKTKLNHTNSKSKAELISYISPNLTDQKSPSLIFVPGGSYTHIDLAQAEKVALRLESFGYQVSVLRYSLVDEVQPLYPAPLIELAEAMDITHQNAEKWQVDVNQIILMGFSVGGHIVSNFNNNWNAAWLSSQTHLASTTLQPFATILGFPVITPNDGFPDTKTLAKWTTHPQQLAADQNATKDNAPTFIWATADDQLVPSQNAVDYFLALQALQVPTELHLYQHGLHGMALADETTAYDNHHVDHRIATWLTTALAWLHELK